MQVQSTLDFSKGRQQLGSDKTWIFFIICLLFIIYYLFSFIIYNLFLFITYFYLLLIIYFYIFIYYLFLFIIYFTYCLFISYFLLIIYYFIYYLSIISCAVWVHDFQGEILLQLQMNSQGKTVTKKAKPNKDICPDSFWTMLEFWLIQHGV